MSEGMNEQTVYWTRPSAHVKLGAIGQVMQYMDARERECKRQQENCRARITSCVCISVFYRHFDSGPLVLLVSWTRWLCQCQPACDCGLGEEWREGGGRGHWGLFWSRFPFYFSPYETWSGECYCVLFCIVIIICIFGIKISIFQHAHVKTHYCECVCDNAWQ